MEGKSYCKPVMSNGNNVIATSNSREVTWCPFGTGMRVHQKGCGRVEQEQEQGRGDRLRCVVVAVGVPSPFG